MSGMTKADYKQQAEELAKELSECRQAGDEYKAALFKREADMMDVIRDKTRELTELNWQLSNCAEKLYHARDKLKMIGDWCQEKDPRTDPELDS